MTRAPSRLLFCRQKLTRQTASPPTAKTPSPTSQTVLQPLLGCLWGWRTRDLLMCSSPEQLFAEPTASAYCLELYISKKPTVSLLPLCTTPDDTSSGLSPMAVPYGSWAKPPLQSATWASVFTSIKR